MSHGMWHLQPHLQEDFSSHDAGTGSKLQSQLDDGRMYEEGTVGGETGLRFTLPSVEAVVVVWPSAQRGQRLQRL